MAKGCSCDPLRHDGRRRRVLARVAAATVIAAAAAMTTLPAATAESPAPIRIALNDWTGQRITSKLMGTALANAGYDVEYVEASYSSQLDAIETGGIDVAMEFWAIAGKPTLDEALATGKVVNLGETGMVAREEWWYPAYVAQLCPGLPDWKALNDCSALFATPETSPLGRYLGGPVTWGGFDEERVESLELRFKVAHADTEAALFAALASAVQRREPIVLWVYAPHWAPSRFHGDWVVFPAYDEGCYAHRRYDCAKPSGPIWKIGAADLEQRWPNAAQAIKAFRITNDEMGDLIARVDVDGVSVEDAVVDWMAAHEATWKSWLD
jgi:glycine betaine/proline transport system substrate-binding protein